MQIERSDLDAAVAQNVLAAEEAHALWNFLEAQRPSRARFTGLNVAYYFGAMVVIAAMGWLMTLGFTSLGPWAVFFFALLYALVFVRAGARLRQELPIPAGLLYTMAVCMTPLAIWGLERATGFWPSTDPGEYREFFPYIRSSWIWMEAGTVLAALFALRRVRFSFLVAPAAVALWFMSMDLTAYLSGHGTSWDSALYQRVSIVFGLAMLFIAWLADHQYSALRAPSVAGGAGSSESDVDFSFWLYLFGMTSLWGALSSMDSGSELRRALYCLLNLFFIVVSVVLRRRVFLVYGAIGVNLYLGTLAYRVFENSVLFPLVLTALGLSIIWLAVKYQRNRTEIDARISSWIPESVRDVLLHTRA
jgi:hypothetical protein